MQFVFNILIQSKLRFKYGIFFFYLIKDQVECQLQSQRFHCGFKDTKVLQ